MKLIQDNPKTMYFINVNSYNLNGRAGEDNDDLIYDIENEKGGILETLLGMNNVFLINPAQVPLGEEEIPYKTCISWIQKIYTTLTSNLGQQGKSLQPAQEELLKKLKGNVFSIDFALRKLKEVGQDQLGAIPDDIQTEFEEYEQGKKPVDTDAWGFFVKGELDKVKAILGETTYKEKKRNIEKMFGAILPGIAALNNDAMGMSYLLAKGLTIAVKEQNGNKSLLLEDLKTLRQQLKEGRDNALYRFKVAISTPKISDARTRRTAHVRAGVGELRSQYMQGNKNIKKEIEDTINRLLPTLRPVAHLEKSTVVEEVFRCSKTEISKKYEEDIQENTKNTGQENTTGSSRWGKNQFKTERESSLDCIIEPLKADIIIVDCFEKALASSSLSGIVTIHEDATFDDISDVFNKFRIMNENDEPSPKEYFKLLLSTFTNFKDRMVTKAKETMPYMDPIHLMKDSAELVGKTQVVDTFDEIITDLEGDDTTAILYGLAFNKEMKVQAQLSKTFMTDSKEDKGSTQDRVRSLLSSFGVAPDKQTLFEDTVTKESSDKYFSNNPKAIFNKMPNSDKVLNNINSLTTIIQGPFMVLTVKADETQSEPEGKP